MQCCQCITSCCPCACTSLLCRIDNTSSRSVAERSLFQSPHQTSLTQSRYHQQRRCQGSSGSRTLFAVLLLLLAAAARIMCCSAQGLDQLAAWPCKGHDGTRKSTSPFAGPLTISGGGSASVSPVPRAKVCSDELSRNPGAVCCRCCSLAGTVRHRPVQLRCCCAPKRECRVHMQHGRASLRQADSFTINHAVISVFSDSSVRFAQDSIAQNTPAVGENGWLYVGTRGKQFFAIDTVSRDIMWTYQGTSYFDYSSPIIGSTGVVYVGCGTTRPVPATALAFCAHDVMVHRRLLDSCVFMCVQAITRCMRLTERQGTWW